MSKKLGTKLDTFKFEVRHPLAMTTELLKTLAGYMVAMKKPKDALRTQQVCEAVATCLPGSYYALHFERIIRGESKDFQPADQAVTPFEAVKATLEEWGAVSEWDRDLLSHYRNRVGGVLKAHFHLLENDGLMEKAVQAMRECEKDVSAVAKYYNLHPTNIHMFVDPAKEDPRKTLEGLEEQLRRYEERYAHECRSGRRGGRYLEILELQSDLQLLAIPGPVAVERYQREVMPHPEGLARMSTVLAQHLDTIQVLAAHAKKITQLYDKISITQRAVAGWNLAKSMDNMDDTTEEFEEWCEERREYLLLEYNAIWHATEQTSKAVREAEPKVLNGTLPEKDFRLLQEEDRQAVLEWEDWLKFHERELVRPGSRPAREGLLKEIGKIGQNYEYLLGGSATLHGVPWAGIISCWPAPSSPRCGPFRRKTSAWKRCSAC
jgi:hypothetical protein